MSVRGLSIGFWCLMFVLVSAANWPRFRGPDGTGQNENTTIPAKWTAKDFLWRVELPGTGQSSPVVWNNQIFVTSALQVDSTRIIRAMRTSDGSLLWERRFQSRPFDLGRSVSYDAASPTVDEDCVYLTWVSPTGYLVLAVNRENGNEVWRRKLGSFEGEHGSGASPIRFADLLIVPNDQKGSSSIVALDCRTGDIRWTVNRRSVKTAYSTPIPYRPDGGAAELIFASTAHGVSSFDPITGDLNWELPEVFGTIRVVGSPVVANGLIFAQCGAGGSGKRMFAITPADLARGEPAKVAYEIKGSLPYVSTPVAHGDRLFLWGDSGIVSCIDTSSGERIWRERVGGNFFASPVRTRDRIFSVSREGEVVILGTQGEFRLLGRVDLEEPSHSTPAVANGVIFFRTWSHLMAIAGK